MSSDLGTLGPRYERQLTFAVRAEENDPNTSLGETDNLFGKRLMVDRLVGAHGGGERDGGPVGPGTRSGSHTDGQFDWLGGR